MQFETTISMCSLVNHLVEGILYFVEVGLHSTEPNPWRLTADILSSIFISIAAYIEHKGLLGTGISIGLPKTS